MSKRQRRKSRKLSEAEQDESLETTPPLDTPTRTSKRRRISIEQERESQNIIIKSQEKNDDKLVVSLQHSTIGTRFMTRLQKRDKITPTNSRQNSTPSPLLIEHNHSVETTPPRADTPNQSISFKNKHFEFSLFADKNKKRNWKSLKQILQSERSAKLDPNFPGYGEIEAPPSLKPPKKYSDISGLLAPYTDPLTELQYNNSSEFEYIRTLPTNIVQGYLSLRGKAIIT